MWELYDELIAGIAPEATADNIICGTAYTAVRSGNDVGICAPFAETWRQPMLPKKTPGMALRELAACVKSWDYQEATIGLAAINAWYNGVERAKALGLAVSSGRHTEDRAADPFIMLQREIAGKTVTVIGHFPYIDQLFAPVCNLSVIEKFYPRTGDYPGEAAEYLLPQSDYVFIASYTLVEKTLPRCLELSRQAQVAIVGPATPLAPLLHRYGARSLAGFVVKDGPLAERIAMGYGGNMHTVGQKVNLVAAG